MEGLTGGFIFRKHALTLQLHTANILSAHAQLDEKNRAIQDVKEQKNKCVRCDGGAAGAG